MENNKLDLTKNLINAIVYSLSFSNPRVPRNDVMIVTRKIENNLSEIIPEYFSDVLTVHKGRTFVTIKNTNHRIFIAQVDTLKDCFLYAGYVVCYIDESTKLNKDAQTYMRTLKRIPG